MTAIDALKRLERAAAEVADMICELPGVLRVALPRGYRVYEHRSNVGSARFLTLEVAAANPGWNEDTGWAEATDTLYIDGCGCYLHGDYHAEVPPQTRRGSLQFADDIAGGLLGEIAELLEKRTEEAAAAAAVLEAVPAG